MCCEDICDGGFFGKCHGSLSQRKKVLNSFPHVYNNCYMNSNPAKSNKRNADKRENFKHKAAKLEQFVANADE